MHRIDATDHVDNQFSDGDAQAGRQGTIVDAAWLNAVQESLTQFMESMGISLVKGDHTQLTDAVLALLARANSWTAQQTFSAAAVLSAGSLYLTQAAAQSIVKSGGALVLGTSSAHDVSLMRSNAVQLLLTASGPSLNNNALLDVARAVLQQLTADPATPAAGSIWYRSDLAKVRARVGTASASLISEAKICVGHVDETTGAVTTLLGTLAVSGNRQSTGLYRLQASGLHQGAVFPVARMPSGNMDRTLRVLPPNLDHELIIQVNDADSGVLDGAFYFLAIVP